jgi:hypothetical protein
MELQEQELRFLLGIFELLLELLAIGIIRWPSFRSANLIQLPPQRSEIALGLISAEAFSIALGLKTLDQEPLLLHLKQKRETALALLREQISFAGDALEAGELGLQLMALPVETGHLLIQPSLPGVTMARIKALITQEIEPLLHLGIEGHPGLCGLLARMLQFLLQLSDDLSVLSSRHLGLNPDKTAPPHTILWTPPTNNQFTTSRLKKSKPTSNAIYIIGSLIVYALG